MKMKKLKVLLASMLACSCLFVSAKASGDVTLTMTKTDADNQGSLKISGLNNVNAVSLNLKIEGEGTLSSMEVSSDMTAQGARVNYKYDENEKTLDIYITAKKALNNSKELELGKLNFSGKNSDSVMLTVNTDKTQAKVVKGTASETITTGKGLTMNSDTIVLKEKADTPDDGDKDDGGKDDNKDDNDKAKDITIEDTSSNIKLFAKAGVLEDGTTAKIIKVDDKTLLNSIKEKLKAISTKFIVYDISLWKDDKAVQPKNDGTVEITLPIPSGYDKDKLAVYCPDDEVLELFSITVKDDAVTFSTTHFSNFVLAEKNAADETGGGNSGNDSSGGGSNSSNKDQQGQSGIFNGANTGDTTMRNVLLLALLAGGAGLIYAGYKFKKH